MNRHSLLHSLAFWLAFAGLSSLAAAAWAATPPDDWTRLRLRSMGSACFTIPTGYCRSEAAYVSDDSHSLTMISQKLLGRFAEVSMVRHLNGATKDRTVFNLKLNVLEEDTYLPNIVWGVSDFRTELGSKIFFLAGSKTIEAFGVTAHAGVYKDPVTTDKETFFGLEKTVFPLVVVAGERIHDQTTVGVKLRPYPGVSVEYARRLDAPDDQASLYRLVYLRAF
ncbi:MAG: hypothetical protein OZSIB_3973 [Candidatus Ozemobacter sibiricus]|jgi:hypothetical protein|uniref:Uncharacterized protein n=1 Tax=Candidatus Ozemobacter sibiricus TaxID=2268124 RepID=A0A367ZQ07_9BACT|nr:MAG: hypothetical protein OZSIB_3973 [Candidatus Ozemobacter sibiricus]